MCEGISRAVTNINWRIRGVGPPGFEQSLSSSMPRANLSIITNGGVDRRDDCAISTEAAQFLATGSRSQMPV